MATEILVVLLCQVVVVGGWALSRRLVRLERSYQGPCYGQVGALREQVKVLRAEHAFEMREQARRIRALEGSTERLGAQMRVLVQQQEQLSNVVVETLGQMEELIVGETPDDVPLQSLAG